MAKRKDDDSDTRMKRKTYEKELLKLQIELCHLQEWVKSKGQRVIIVFEGRDAAGKGGTIKPLTGRVCARVFRGTGRDDQSPHGASEPARFSRDCAAGAFGLRKEPAVYPAIYRALSGRRRN